MIMTSEPGQFSRWRADALLSSRDGRKTWRGWDRLLGRPVLFKVLPEQARASAAAQLQLAGHLAHPNLGVPERVVPLEGGVAVVSGFHEGGELATWLAARPRPVEARLRVVCDVARAVSVLHARGLVHRDVKAENVVLVGDGDEARAVLVDLDLLTPEGGAAELSGTLPVLAPELLAGEPTTTAVDIYGLGWLLRFALGGAVPEATTLRPGAAAPNSSDAAAGLLGPPSAHVLLQEMLSANPAARPSALDVARRLQVGSKASPEAEAALLARLGPAPLEDRPELRAALSTWLPLRGAGGDAPERADSDGGRLRAPRLGALWVEASRGAGRTTALRHACVLAAEAGWDVLGPDSPRTLDELRSWLGMAPGRGVPALAAELLAGLTRPTLVALDDVDDASSATRELLGAVARLHGAGHERVLFVLTRELPRREGGGGEALAAVLARFCEVEVVRLSPLSAGAVERALGRLSTGHAISSSLVAEVTRRSQGEPALLTGALSALLPVSPLVTGTAFPADAEGLLDVVSAETLNQARVHAAPPHALALAELVAVAGDLPRHVVLRCAAASGLPATSLDRGVEHSLLADGAGGMVRATGASALLVAETGDPPARLRSGDHARDALLRASLPVLDEEPAHASAAARVRAHLGDFDAAATVAERLGDFDAAARWLERAPEAAGRSARLARLYTTLGRFSEARAAVRGDPEGRLALAALESEAGRHGEALALLDGLPDSRRRRCLAARAALHLGRAAEALEGAEAALQGWQGGAVPSSEALLAGVDPAGPGFSGAHASPEDLVHARLTRVLALFYLGRYDPAAEEAGALALVERAREDASRELPMIENALAIICQRRGDRDGAREGYARSLAVARAHGNLPRVGIALMNLGTLAQEAGEPGEALMRYAEADAVARRTGDDTALAKALLNVANLLVELGDFDAAAQRVEAGARLGRALGSELSTAYFTLVRADLSLCCQRDPSAGLRAADDAAARFQALALRREASEAELVAARLALLDHQDVGRYLEALARAARDLDHPRWRVWYAVIRSEVALRGRADPVALLDELEAVLLADGPAVRPEDVWPLERMAARVAALAGRGELARARGSAALRTLERLHARVPEERSAAWWSVPERNATRELATLLRLESEAGLLGPVLDLNARLATETDPERLLRAILDIAIGITGAERGFVLTADPETDELVVRAARNFEQETLRRASTRYSASIAEEVLATARPLLAVDAMDDERLRRNESVHAMKLRSVLCVPMRDRGAPIGVVYVDNRFQRGAFSRDQLRFLEAFADQAAIAVTRTETLRREQVARADAEARRAELEVARAEVERLNADLLVELERQSTRLRNAEEALESTGRARAPHPTIVGDSPAVRRLLSIIERVAPTAVSVLVTGESGVGKELVARALHDGSPRARGPFVSVNCAALPEALLESEFFGVVRGAFTGADRDRAGLFERAHGGTLFLDEVGEMSLALQAKLLRALETRQVRRVGGAEDVAVDVRIVSATNRDLASASRPRAPEPAREPAQPTFREDLLFRLRVVAIEVPPLRERREDIPRLVEHLSGRARERLGLEPRPLAPDALAALLRYGWPGNIRELDAVLSEAFLLATGPVVGRGDLRISTTTSETAHGPSGGIRWDGVSTFDEAVRQLATSCWEQVGKNQSKAADALGIDRNTLRARLGYTVRRPR